MSNVLGIDYGKSKIGLSVGDSESNFAEPLMVIRYKDIKKVIEKIFQVVQVERVDKVVLGLSEGKTAEATRKFGDQLQKKLKLPVKYFDETLSTKEAQKLSREAGMKRKKRKAMEDAFAATFMLQNYLEENSI